MSQIEDCLVGSGFCYSMYVYKTKTKDSKEDVQFFTSEQRYISPYKQQHKSHKMPETHFPGNIEFLSCEHLTMLCHGLILN